jgi:ribosome-binding factor A
MSRRTEKIGSAIRQEVSQVIMRELNDPRLDGLLPSISRVKVAEDMSIADLYVIFMGTQGKQAAGLAALRHAAGMMRTRVAKALTTRTVPYLRFHLDEAYRKEMEVLDLIRRVEREHAVEAEESGEAAAPEGGVPDEETERKGP